MDGRVKAIYAETDEDIATVMYENGALILLSLDGYMATEVSSETFTAGETLITLTDTETSANYDALLKERAEYGNFNGYYRSDDFTGYNYGDFHQCRRDRYFVPVRRSGSNRKKVQPQMRVVTKYRILLVHIRIILGP